MTTHGDRRGSSRTAGSVLIFTLWILVCLSLMSLGFGHRVRLETKATAYTRANVEAFYLAEIALYDRLIEVAEATSGGGQRDRRRDGQRGRQPDRQRGRQPDWQRGTQRDRQRNGQPARRAGRRRTGQEEDVEIRCKVVSEEGKININRAPEDLLRDVKPLRGKVMAAITRRLRGNDREAGTEDDEPFRLAEELLLAAKIDEKDWYGKKEGEPGIRDLVTVYGGGRIDLNKASLDVLQAIPRVKRRVAEDIVAYRAGLDGQDGTDDDQRWKSVQELKRFLDLSDGDAAPFEKYCKFESHFYTVTAAARKTGSRATARISAVARVQDGKFEILSWRED